MSTSRLAPIVSRARPISICSRSWRRRGGSLRVCPRARSWTARRAAVALGFEDDYGTLDVGRRAQVIAVRIPSGVNDVEEYLVSGIEPSDVQWLDPSM